MPIFDAHFHVIDPRFPLVPNQGFLPEPFTVSDYRSRVAGLDVVGGAVVSGSFQAYDQTYLVDALAQLGPGFVGVANVPSDISDDEVLALAEAGVRAFRVNLFRGGDVAQVALAPRLYELAGWHLEVYLDARDLPELAPKLARRAAARDRPSRHDAGRSARVAGPRKGRRVRQGQRFRADRRRSVLGAAGDRDAQSGRAGVRLRPPRDPRAAPVRGRGHRAGGRGRGRARAVRQRARALPLSHDPDVDLGQRAEDAAAAAARRSRRARRRAEQDVGRSALAGDAREHVELVALLDQQVRAEHRGQPPQRLQPLPLLRGRLLLGDHEDVELAAEALGGAPGAADDALVALVEGRRTPAGARRSAARRPRRSSTFSASWRSATSRSALRFSTRKKPLSAGAIRACG